jgi:glutamate racemase
MTIGICDYGIGGIGLFNAIRDKSSVDIIYFSDSGYTPYGKVSEEDLKERLGKVINYFHQQGVDHIAVACNAASTVIPQSKKITGIIEHGINMVLEIAPDNVVVAGGIRTIESCLYKYALEQKGIKVSQVIAQQLSLRIEQGDVDSKDLDDDIQTIFEPVQNMDYLLLACTHYPIIEEKIRTKVKKAMLLDPVQKMTDWIFNNWSPLTGSSTVKWITTGSIEQMQMACRNAYELKLNEIQKVSL